RIVDPYVLHLSKMHTLDVPTVNQITKELFVLASEGGGTYDGWGTKLKLKLPARIRAYVKRVFLKFISTFT
uniref:ribonuclease E inhibitor RraB n=1 Tax=Lysinibacillus sp. GbtcB16 TaxID=2824761 RepID=UPI001C2F3543